MAKTKTLSRGDDTPILEATLPQVLAALNAVGVTTVEQFGDVMAGLALGYEIARKQAEIDKAVDAQRVSNDQFQTLVTQLQDQLAALNKLRIQ